jgi:type IV pilus assembly protein PilQ
VERIGNVIHVSSAAHAQSALDARERGEPLQTDVFHLRFAHASSVAQLLTGQRDRVLAANGYDQDEDRPPNEQPEFQNTRTIRNARLNNAAYEPRPAVLSQRGSAVADELSNTLIVTDVDRGLVAARQIVQEIDQPTPQVQIESRIIEASETFERAIGIQWGYRYTASGASGNPTGLNFPGSLSVGGSPAAPGSGGLNAGVDPVTGAIVPFVADFPALGGLLPGNGSAIDLALGSITQSQILDLRLTQLETQGRIKIVSRPRIVTRNNQEAVIKAVDVVRVRLPSSTVINGFVGYPNYATERIEVGVLLKVRPQVSSDGFILLDMKAVSSTLLSSQVDNIPIQEERATESHVLLHDGQTLVIGGIYRVEDNLQSAGLPYLRSLPIFGWLFGTVAHQNRRQELVIFVTPHQIATPVIASGRALPPASQLWLNRSGLGG